MSVKRPFAFVLTLLSTIFWILPPAAYADRIGKPYRGPIEYLGAGSSQDQETDSPDLGGEGDTGEGGGEGGGEEGGEEEGETGPTPGGGSAPSAPGGGTRTGGAGEAKLDGQILWQWWWEHNKDRFLARSTERGRVNAGSIEYWFGAGAKYPPRDIVPISEKQRKSRVFKTLKRRLGDSSAAVRAEACVAAGRLGFVPPSEKEKKEGVPDNLVVRALIDLLEKEGNREVRTSAILGLGICGDPAGCDYLSRNYQKLSPWARAYANIAFGLAGYTKALKTLTEQLPKNARARGITHQMISAATGIGLMGLDALQGEDALTEENITHLRKLANPGGHDALVMQVVTALSRLQIERKTVVKLATVKTSKNIKWTTILALANYSRDEKDAASVFKTLQGRKCFGSGDGQDKSFSVLAMGELASHLDPNSTLRARILKFLTKEALDTKNNYVRSCAAVALGVANDRTRTTVDAIANLLTDTTVQDHVVSAACIGLGLLRATEHVDAMRTRVMLNKKWQADTRGYAALGIALTGDTTRIKELLDFAGTSSLNDKTRRQLPLALGVLGDREQVRKITAYFAKQWKKNERYEVSNAAFGLAWLRDESAVGRLRRMAKRPDAKVRGMAVIALGYSGARDAVDPLSRCYANVSFRNRFGNWDLLLAISRIL
ncbi:MAG: HEAT repeat domain-containing protein [Planctomycetota bacterium]|jgi:HEAT repeat protein